MVRALGIGIGVNFGGGVVSRWAPLAGAAVHLDFVNRKYYWNGAERLSTDFTAFTGGTFSNGLVTDGTASSRDIRIDWSSINIAFPCALIASFTPASVTGSQYVAEIDVDASNLAAVGLSNTFRRVQVLIANVAQADLGVSTAAIGTLTTVGGNFETNNVLQSADGATGAAADTSVTLPTPTSLRISERAGNLQPFIGTIHHVVIASGAQTQAQLNALTAAVHAL